MTPEQFGKSEQLQNTQQLESDLAWQTERANTAVNRFQEMRAERDALQARIDGALAADCFEEAFEILARESE